MIKIKIVFILTFLCTLNLYSQSKTTAEDIFKMHLFLDKKNITRSDLSKTVVKNDSLYDSFKKNCSIKLDTLKLKSNIFLSIDGDFTFYTITDIKYSDSLNTNESWFLKIDLGYDSKYIIAINQNTGRSYRLSGFYSNDFFAFYFDIKKAYRDYNFKDLKKKLFFREYFVESIDFKCLYKGLRQNKIDKERFPCLKTCSDTFSMHQFKIK
ncbi:hypothetical protein SY27_04940 [Flavobacterium sp. 316]|uniref:hypothetical protein n=1 Tax=Flavobacterium sp. 316 TaxID=1603293 RepID=UPI0005E6003E|nr:hypothetical protein [Flavobacterium sp. 316]KIX22023.1 hypothetical protein SY27_04940 [Flavobacterium sp. 316]